jgi:hypothetical protein
MQHILPYSTTRWTAWDEASKLLLSTKSLGPNSSHSTLTCNVPRNQPDHVTNPIKKSMITTT